MNVCYVIFLLLYDTFQKISERAYTLNSRQPRKAMSVIEE